MAETHCQYCSRDCGSVPALRKHENVCDQKPPEEPYFCQYCKERLRTRSEREDHELGKCEKHPPFVNPFETLDRCPRCQFRMPHLEVIEGNADRACLDCGCVFMSEVRRLERKAEYMKIKWKRPVRGPDHDVTA
jgi:hypothetical protein